MGIWPVLRMDAFFFSPFSAHARVPKLADYILAGFARQIRGVAAGNGWDHIYDIAYFYGFLVALGVYWGLSTAVPSRSSSGQPRNSNETVNFGFEERSKFNTEGI